MKQTIFSLIAILALTSLSFRSPDPDEEKSSVEQNLLTRQTQKLVEDLQKELDKVLVRYEEKLDEQLEKVDDKMESQIKRLDVRFDEIQKKLDAQVSKAEGRLDETFDKVDNEMGDVKSTLLSTVGTVAWRFTIVDIVTAVLATFLTAFLTSWLTARKIQAGKFRKELESLIDETKRVVNAAK
ncbi:MAG: hypothetical protein RIM99_02645 [Cyclobacteriaceae bacterium]